MAKLNISDGRVANTTHYSCRMEVVVAQVEELQEMIGLQKGRKCAPKQQRVIRARKLIWRTVKNHYYHQDLNPFTLFQLCSDLLKLLQLMLNYYSKR